MKRKDLLARVGIAAGSASLMRLFGPGAVGETARAEEGAAPLTHQFARGEFTELSEQLAGHPNAAALMAASRDGWEYVWTYTLRNGIRFVDGMRLVQR
jgi:hypothetical protein